MESNNLKNKKILITGHNGFKGSYLCKLLLMLGANVYGFSLQNNEDDLYTKTKLSKYIPEKLADIRNYDEIEKYVDEIKPDIIIHMAAQALVLDSYSDPKYTYEVNTLGTVNILECVKKCDNTELFFNVTTDKVYENLDEEHFFTEDEKLDGTDPYSNSKSCSELITHSYKKSFLNDKIVLTARAGNVIGGGDMAQNRIIPDCVRAVQKKEAIIIRNPNSIRPYEYVLEAVFAYSKMIDKTLQSKNLQGSYNVGPDKKHVITTLELVKYFIDLWGDASTFIIKQNLNAPKEAKLLMLDNTKIFNAFGIKPLLSIEEALERTVNFYKNYLNEDVDNLIENEIKYFDKKL